MKLIKKILLNVVIIVWLIIALFTTICLLSFNKFGTSVIGKNTLLIIDSDELEPDYKEGDLLVIKRNSDSKINVGDKVFYYNSSMNTSTLVFVGEIEKKTSSGKSEPTYTIDKEKVSSEYIIGKTTSVKKYSKLGTVLGALTSKWGFLFFILFPMLFAIIYEIMAIVDSTKNKTATSK